MRQTYLSSPLLFISIVFSSHAETKTDISVQRFTDNTGRGKCSELTEKAKVDLDKELQNKLISGLMELKRFQIQEREVRLLKPKHSIIGSVRVFEVCADEKGGEKAQVDLEIQLLSTNGEPSHSFSSSVSASNTTANQAPQMAINSSINEIIKRIDEAIPRRNRPLRIASRRAPSSASPIVVKLLPRNRK